MTDLSRVFDHQRAGGHLSVADYALELEEVLQAIVIADLDGEDVDGHDMHVALLSARALVEGWDIRP